MVWKQVLVGRFCHYRNTLSYLFVSPYSILFYYEWEIKWHHLIGQFSSRCLLPSLSKAFYITWSFITAIRIFAARVKISRAASSCWLVLSLWKYPCCLTAFSRAEVAVFIRYWLLRKLRIQNSA